MDVDRIEGIKQILSALRYRHETQKEGSHGLMANISNADVVSDLRNLLEVEIAVHLCRLQWKEQLLLY
jgi:hypothetical protein